MFVQFVMSLISGYVCCSADYNSSLSGDVAAGGPARAARLQLGQEGLLHRLLQCDALQIKIF